MWRKLLFAGILAVAVFAGFSLYADVDKLGARLATFPLSAWAAALALALANYALRFVRWELYLGRSGIRIPRATSLRIFLSGFAMSVTPGKVGELLKAAMLKDAAGVPVRRSAPVVVAERITDLLSVLLLAVAGAALYGVAVPTVAAAGAIVAGVFVILLWRSFTHKVLDVLERFKLGARYAPRLRDAYDHLGALVRPGPLLWATAIALLAWLCECFGFAIIVEGFPGASVPLGLAVLIYAATTIAGALSFLPGGLLVTEASMIYLLVRSAHGLDEAGAVAATIVTRLCTLWFAVLLGFVALAFRRRGGRIPA